MLVLVLVIVAWFILRDEVVDCWCCVLSLWFFFSARNFGLTLFRLHHQLWFIVSSKHFFIRRCAMLLTWHGRMVSYCFYMTLFSPCCYALPIVLSMFPITYSLGLKTIFLLLFMTLQQRILTDTSLLKDKVLNIEN